MCAAGRRAITLLLVFSGKGLPVEIVAEFENWAPYSRTVRAKRLDPQSIWRENERLYVPLARPNN